MAIVYQTDKRSGITYAYESTSVWDKEKKQSRSKRKLLGRVDPETKEIIQTDGRCKRLSPYATAEEKAAVVKKTQKEIILELQEKVAKLEESNANLVAALAALNKDLAALKTKQY